MTPPPWSTPGGRPAAPPAPVSVAAEPDRDIPKAMLRLEEAIQAAVNAADELEVRLAPVVRPGVEDPKVASDKAVPLSSVPLAQRLLASETVCLAFTRRVRDVLERLGV